MEEIDCTLMDDGNNGGGAGESMVKNGIRKREGGGWSWTMVGGGQPEIEYIIRESNGDVVIQEVV